jgi:prevent-host-death family protein
VVRALAAGGPVVVTNHAEPEAVIVSAAEYERLLILVGQATAKADAALDTLRHRFDERLAALQDPDAGPRLRSVMNRPAKLKGRVKAGRGY